MSLTTNCRFSDVDVDADGCECDDVVSLDIRADGAVGVAGADFPAVDADVEERSDIEQIENAEICVEGLAPPTGWRFDRLGARLVSTPPWSRRPPNCESEVWGHLE